MRPPTPQIARAQWLLGLDAPESAEEIRRAWKERVARTHPDRNAERAGAATRVTAAFNQARELCEWWLEAGSGVAQADGARGAARAGAGARRASAARTPEQNRSSFRAGDLVARAVPGRDPPAGPLLTVRASGHRRRTAASSSRTASSAAPGRSGAGGVRLPVCGLCSGPAVERPALRPCPSCLAELVLLERSERAVEPALRGIRSRARAGRATAAELGDHGLEELARERYRWAEGVARRPREERRGNMLAAYAHAYALWAAGSTARDAAGV